MVELANKLFYYTKKMVELQISKVTSYKLWLIDVTHRPE